MPVERSEVIAVPVRRHRGTHKVRGVSDSVIMTPDRKVLATIPARPITPLRSPTLPRERRCRRTKLDCCQVRERVFSVVAGPPGQLGYRSAPRKRTLVAAALLVALTAADQEPVFRGPNRRPRVDHPERTARGTVELHFRVPGGAAERWPRRSPRDWRLLCSGTRVP